MNKIIIDIFSDTGKWYERITDTTDFKVFEYPEIKIEMEQKYPLLRNHNYSIFIYAEGINVENHRLVLKN